MTDNEYYRAHHLDSDETFCPLIRDVCVNDSCEWWREDFGQCSAHVIAEMIARLTLDELDARARNREAR